MSKEDAGKADAGYFFFKRWQALPVLAENTVLFLAGVLKGHRPHRCRRCQRTPLQEDDVSVI